MSTKVCSDDSLSEVISYTLTASDESSAIRIITVKIIAANGKNRRRRRLFLFFIHICNVF